MTFLTLSTFASENESSLQQIDVKWLQSGMKASLNPPPEKV